jgi:hypothetical protein
MTLGVKVVGAVMLCGPDLKFKEATLIALQYWVCELTIMQQSVLMAAVRGPDTIPKNHVAKLLLRWYRRCILLSAFDRRVLTNPYEPVGGSFTGPSIGAPIGQFEKADESLYWYHVMQEKVSDYLTTVDELPHHFQLHFMHAAEILGYKHPDDVIRAWWQETYQRLVNDMHLFPETEEQMDTRLGDKEKDWRAREEVIAKGPSEV